MKNNIIGIILFCFLFCIISCGKSTEDICKECYELGYKDAKEHLKQSSTEFRNELKAKIDVQLFFYSIFIVIIALFGIDFAERVREKTKNFFHPNLLSSRPTLSCQKHCVSNTVNLTPA